MASILDTLIVNQQNQVAPNDRRFNMNEFLTAAGQVKNMNESLNEIQRQNSLRNLIAQRERDGVPFDRISNEAAKYDLGKALSMRGEARESIGFNQQQSDIELKRFKSEMAGYWFGEVLRRTQAEGKGVEEIAAIAKEAAGLIAPYDSKLAYDLLNMAETDAYRRNAAAAKSQGKPVGDDTRQFNANKKKYLEVAKDPNQAPYDINRNKILGEIDGAILNWKQNSEFDMDRFGYNSGYERSIVLPMESGVMNYIYSRFGGDVEKNDKKTDEVIAWLRGIGDDELAGILNQYSGEQDKTPVAQLDGTGESEKEISSVTQTIGQKNTDPKIEKQTEIKVDNGLPKSVVYKDRNGIETFSPSKVAQLDAAVPSLLTNEDFEQAFKLANELGKVESGESKLFEPTKKAIRDQQKLVKETLDALKVMGAGISEAKLKKFKEIFGTRASMDVVRQFRNFHAFTAAYVSKTPLTVLSNGLLVGTPSYKPTEGELNVAKSVHSATNWSENVKSMLAKSKIPFASSIASFNNEYDALWSLGSDVKKQMSGIWEGLTDGMTDEQKQQTKEMYSNMFGMDSNDWAIIEDPSVVYPRDKEYERQLALLENTNSNTTKMADLTKVQGKGGETKSSVKTTSASALLERLRAKKVGSK